MISVSAKYLRYPVDVSQLYWLQNTGRDTLASPSPSSFYFASDDGARLVSAVLDEARFITALGDAISQLGSLPCAAGLQTLLDELTAVDVVPAPRYPQIGDTNLHAFVRWVWNLQKYDKDTQTHFPVWSGVVDVAVSANNFDAQPAYEGVTPDWLKAGYGGVNTFVVSFRDNLTELQQGQAVLIDIALPEGLSAPVAVNIRPA